MPYIKTYTNGDRLEIIYNGQLEMLLYNKGRSPSVRTRATNYGTWINAEMWLHGSCADVTEGLCGRWNGNQGDDLINNDPNTNGEQKTHFLFASKQSTVFSRSLNTITGGLYYWPKSIEIPALKYYLDTFTSPDPQIS